MNWTQVVLAFVASAVLASFTDWYFFGVLFHDRYRTTPGVWRQYKDKKDEMRSIAISELFMSISSFVFILASAHQGWTSLSKAAVAALVAWVMIPVPLPLPSGSRRSSESSSRTSTSAGSAPGR